MSGAIGYMKRGIGRNRLDWKRIRQPCGNNCRTSEFKALDQLVNDTIELGVGKTYRIVSGPWPEGLQLF